MRMDLKFEGNENTLIKTIGLKTSTKQREENRNIAKCLRSLSYFQSVIGYL